MQKQPAKEPVLIEARRREVATHRLNGEKVKDIARRMNLSERTVKRDLDRARKSGLLREFEDAVMERLVPKALEQYESALRDGDLFVAKDVLHHAARIADRDVKVKSRAAGMSLQMWLQMRKENQGKEEDEDALQAGGQESITGELIVHELDESTPEGPEGDGEDDDEDTPVGDLEDV